MADGANEGAADAASLPGVLDQDADFPVTVGADCQAGQSETSAAVSGAKDMLSSDGGEEMFDVAGAVDVTVESLVSGVSGASPQELGDGRGVAFIEFDDGDSGRDPWRGPEEQVARWFNLSHMTRVNADWNAAIRIGYGLATHRPRTEPRLGPR